jgi:hypothetical protein
MASTDVIGEARKLTAKYGNVYAVVHAFSTRQTATAATHSLKTVSADGPRLPVSVTSVVNPKTKMQVNVLFYTRNRDKEKLNVSSGNFDLPRELGVKMTELNKWMDSQSDTSYLALVEPDKYYSCGEHRGLDEEARNISTDTLKLFDYCVDLLAAVERCTGKHTLLFVSGYRFSYPEKVHHDDIYTSDVVDEGQPYWENGMNADFIERLKADNVYYMDGQMSITTSNHNHGGDVEKSMLKFYCSAQASLPAWSGNLQEDGIKYASSAASTVVSFIPVVGKPLSITLKAAEMELCSKVAGGNRSTLNTEPNREGFNQRREAGTRAGTSFLYELQTNGGINKNPAGAITDTLDIVCHSMGYAYSLGIIDALKGKVPFGRFYIIAPENAGSGGTDWTQFTEVWQYGSDENKDPVSKQDGVAPQAPCQGIPNLSPNKGGRAYIPDTEKKGFLTSHSIGNYGWIFDLQVNNKGYVKPRQ